jgi:2-oxoglutarate dehydrogenase E1 component
MKLVFVAQLDGQNRNCTIHIVINNQVGFTDYLDARSSTYCTDVAKVTLSPVLHVNADDAEAVVHYDFALDFRMRFARDVFIDLLGYRKYRHTKVMNLVLQPVLYKIITKHKILRSLCEDKLIADGIIDAGHVKVLKRIQADLEMNLEASARKTLTIITPFMREMVVLEQVTDVQMLEK